MKKFFKFLFVIISIAAICGCAYFGYMYFKDKIGGNAITLTSADAKELVFTAAYDLDIVTEVDFRDNIGKTPIQKPDNYNKNWGYESGIIDTSNTAETYKTYNDDFIYFKCDNHLCEYNIPAIDRELNNVCSFFKKDITAKTYYSLNGINGYYTLEKNVLTFRFWSTESSSSYAYYAKETVVKYTVLSKNSDGIAKYTIDIKYFEAKEHTIGSNTYNSSDLHTTSLTIGADNNGNKQIDQLYASLTFISNRAIKSYSDFENSSISEYTYTFDCNIVDNKILYFGSDLAGPFDKMVESLSADVHFDVPVYYADKTITNL